MSCLYFNNDYNRGAHPKIIEAIVKTNGEALDAYGFDKYSLSAERKILEACCCPEGQVYFISGGTQTNQVVIDTMLASYEGAVSASTGHINAHESGAVEFTGHKVLPLPSHGGKITAEELRDMLVGYYNDANHEHMVWPGIVYISQPTEYGTLYSKRELEDIYAVCQSYELPLFIDGARLIYALCSEGADLALPDYARLCDVFYIGGTKAGTLCGEAVVFTHGSAPKHFLSSVKQHGAMLAKSRILGVQFDALFTDGLYLEIGRHGIETASRLKRMLADLGLPFLLDSPTNQQFVIMENSVLAELESSVKYSFWEAVDEGHTAVRFATSWSTEWEELDALEALLKEKLG